MPKKQSQKVKGCRKSGRSDRKIKGRVSAISAFVRDKITAAEYFRQTGQPHKG